jgi:ABC-type multidrug transport system ATPase subunit
MKSITLKNISKSFLGKTLFEDVSFSVQKGDRIAITGKNGAGKSTLLKIIIGTEDSDAGRVLKEKVSCRYVPQEFSGDQTLSIMEYLDSTGATNRVFDVLNQFKVITEDQIENSYIQELSGGQKRVLEIAMVLSHSPMFYVLMSQKIISILNRGLYSLTY